MNPKTYNLEIRPSPIHGQGLFALCKIRKGTMICPFVGVEMTYKEIKEKYGDDFRFIYRRMNWQKWIVCKDERNVISWCNDGVYNQKIQSFNCILQKASLFAIKDIDVGEELLLDYGEKYWRQLNKHLKHSEPLVK
jgi:SET domain-containing protein